MIIVQVDRISNATREGYHPIPVPRDHLNKTKLNWEVLTWVSHKIMSIC